MIKNYFLRHLQTLFFSLGQMARAPLATLMTVAVIGITLALPTGLYLLLDNLQRLSGGWDAGVQISLFLKQDIGDAEAGRIAERLRAREEIESVRYVSRQAALAEFKRLSGFGEALNLLDENPLPAVLLVRPKPAHGSPQAAAALARSLGETRGVDLAQLDLEWVKRLNAMLSLARRGVILLAGLLGLAVLLIVGNTIRLAVLNRRTEIEVVKLIGGTDRFIRRPFLYSGLLQGLAGALTGWAVRSPTWPTSMAAVSGWRASARPRAFPWCWAGDCWAGWARGWQSAATCGKSSRPEPPQARVGPDGTAGRFPAPELPPRFGTLTMRVLKSTTDTEDTAREIHR